MYSSPKAARGAKSPLYDYLEGYQQLIKEAQAVSGPPAKGQDGALAASVPGSRVTITDRRLEVTTPEGVSLEATVAAAFAGWRPTPKACLDGMVLPDGIIGTWSRGRTCVVARQEPAGLHLVRWWVGGDAHGSGAEYEPFTIALPYLIVLAAFVAAGDGTLQLDRKKVECFVSNRPLKSPDDPISPCPLLNVSRFALGGKAAAKPIAWLCTQFLPAERLARICSPNERLRETFRELHHVAYETPFNFSSESQDDEGDSWWSTHVRQGAPRTRAAISDIHEWQRRSKADPAFVLDLEWIDVRMTLGRVADRLLRITNAPEPPPLDCAEDIARLASVAVASHDTALL